MRRLDDPTWRSAGRLALSALAAICVLSLLAVATVPAGNLADKDRAKQADKCQTQITSEGVKFVENKLKKLTKCVDEVMECVQEEDDESVDGCIDKATTKCDKELAKIFDKDESKMRGDILKKCVDDDLDFDDLMHPIGVGFDAHASLCADQFGTPLADPNDVADCIVAHNECQTERMLRVQAPRALALMLHASVDAGLMARLSCLEGNPGATGGFGDIDAKNVGKPIVKCHKEIEKRTRTFIKKKLKSIEKCTGDLFECVQEDPGDQKCIDKAIGKCDKEFGPDGKIAKEEGKLREKVAKKCGPDEINYSDLRGASGLNFDDLPGPCAALGVSTPLDNLDEYTECLFRQTECLVDDIIRIQTPRLRELLTIAGREDEVPAPFCPTPTPTPSVTPTPTPTPTFTPAPGEFLVAVTKLGNGVGAVVSDPPGIDCGTTCAGSFPGSNIDLIALPTNGSDSRFDGWSGDFCSGLGLECTSLLVNQHRLVNATFVQQEANLIFQTFSPVSLTLGDVTAYDQVCNDAATAAGLNTGANDGFSAWMSEVGSIAPDRLGTARGWVRMDGKPFADEISELTADEVFNPVFYEELGTKGNGTVATGAIGNGNRAGNCDNWTNSGAGSAIAGSAFGGPKVWTFSPLAICSVNFPIYCMGKSKTVEVDPAPTAGKVIYASTTPLVIGTDPDTHCDNEKPAGAGTVKALVARTTASADTHLDSGTTYVRPDGQVVGTGADIVAVAAETGGSNVQLASGIWQRGDGSYTGSAFNLWTGQDDVTTLGTIATTCDDWTDSAGTGQQGTSPSSTNPNFWNGVDGIDCSLTTKHVYCVEQ